MRAWRQIERIWWLVIIPTNGATTISGFFPCTIALRLSYMSLINCRCTSSSAPDDADILLCRFAIRSPILSLRPPDNSDSRHTTYIRNSIVCSVARLALSKNNKELTRPIFLIVPSLSSDTSKSKSGRCQCRSSAGASDFTLNCRPVSMFPSSIARKFSVASLSLNKSASLRRSSFSEESVGCGNAWPKNTGSSSVLEHATTNSNLFLILAQSCSVSRSFSTKFKADSRPFNAWSYVMDFVIAVNSIFTLKRSRPRSKCDTNPVMYRASIDLFR